MNRSQKGFTLIELVVVVVLLGIVGAVATARFQDLSTGANTAALNGVAAELGSASAINYAAGAVGTPAVDLSNDVNCGDTGGANDVEDLFQTGAPPTGYTLNAAQALGCGAAAAGTAIACTLTQTATGNTANVNIICTG